jgi:hypothetical protein
MVPVLDAGQLDNVAPGVVQDNSNVITSRIAKDGSFRIAWW